MQILGIFDDMKGTVFMVGEFYELEFIIGTIVNSRLHGNVLCLRRTPDDYMIKEMIFKHNLSHPVGLSKIKEENRYGEYTKKHFLSYPTNKQGTFSPISEQFGMH